MRYLLKISLIMLDKKKRKELSSITGTQAVLVVLVYLL